MVYTTTFDTADPATPLNNTKTLAQLGLTDISGNAALTSGGLSMDGTSLGNQVYKIDYVIDNIKTLHPKVSATFNAPLPTGSAVLLATRHNADGSKYFYKADNGSNLFAFTLNPDATPSTILTGAAPPAFVAGPVTVAMELFPGTNGVGTDFVITTINNGVTTVQTATSDTIGPQTAGNTGVGMLANGTITGIKVQNSDAMAAGGTLILYDGDSLTFGFNTSNPPTTAFPALDQTSLNALNDGAFTTINNGVSGKQLSQINTDFATLSAPKLAGTYANKIYVLEGGYNDFGNSQTAAQVEASIQALAGKARAAGATKVILCTIPHLPTQTLHATLNSWILANPQDGVSDWANYPTLSDTSNATYYNSDKLHPNDAGDVEISKVNLALYRSFLNVPTVDHSAYNSTPSNEVSTLVGFVPVTPVITAFSGMSTFPNPQVSLTWGAGNWLRILVQMMTVGGAGTLGTFQTVLTIAEAIPGDATSVPTTIVLNNINLPAADAMAFGVQYKFRLIAQGG